MIYLYNKCNNDIIAAITTKTNKFNKKYENFNNNIRYNGLIIKKCVNKKWIYKKKVRLDIIIKNINKSIEIQNAIIKIYDKYITIKDDHTSFIKIDIKK